MVEAAAFSLAGFSQTAFAGSVLVPVHLVDDAKG